MWVTSNYKGEQIWYSKEEYEELKKKLEKDLKSVSEVLLKFLDKKLKLDEEETKQLRKLIEEFINE